MQINISLTTDVETLVTRVALGLITGGTVFVLARSTLHGVVQAVGPVWAGPMTVCVPPDGQISMLSVWTQKQEIHIK